MLQKDIIKKIENYLNKEKEFVNLDFSKLSLFTPKNIAHGDFSTNFALIIASELKINPNELANKITSTLLKRKDKFFDKIEVAKPGFINFTISKEVYQNLLKRINQLGNKFGSSKKNKKRVCVGKSNWFSPRWSLKKCGSW